MKKRRLSFILSFILMTLLAVATLSGCNDNTGTTNNTTKSVTAGAETTETETVEDTQEIGAGAYSFVLEVTTEDGALLTWNVHTDATTVGDALLEIGFIAGDETDFGLMVTTVNGITADWDADNAFWAFFINGAFADTGVSDTEIEPGAIYAFIYTES
ncbi:MAG: DUF4430 domain-containing protein [Lachnospiraceae bacterium]|nr:DUF4430 domain-containing protein [Lachnospiraceae bacterium]